MAITLAPIIGSPEYFNGDINLKTNSDVPSLRVTMTFNNDKSWCHLEELFLIDHGSYHNDHHYLGITIMCCCIGAILFTYLDSNLIIVDSNYKVCGDS